jgi:hypothetical protein
MYRVCVFSRIRVVSAGNVQVFHRIVRWNQVCVMPMMGIIPISRSTHLYASGSGADY